MERDNVNKTGFYYAKGVVWKVVLAAALVFLIERFIMKGLAHQSHHVKPIFMALCVIFTIVLATIGILLIYLAIQDCRNVYGAIRACIMVKPPSTLVAEDCPNTVSDQV